MLRRKFDKKPKLAAANGTKIKVHASRARIRRERESAWHEDLRATRRSCSRAASAMIDGRNTFVFGTKRENDIENHATGEKIMIERVGDTLWMTLPHSEGGETGRRRGKEVRGHGGGRDR